ncbi:hypothetical protein CTEN210_12749 [Chaetoceros tenuissimus]|uniref:Uncharacterized protein n=1 Tax=Chaetoceros tenuissimus TaxID=426638 RepID=A0AAD3D1X9_9STRA|nr:hypothetical protein CTEN210_12749 [Chaetoceros tenuissimus]
MSQECSKEGSDLLSTKGDMMNKTDLDVSLPGNQNEVKNETMKEDDAMDAGYAGDAGEKDQEGDAVMNDLNQQQQEEEEEKDSIKHERDSKMNEANDTSLQESSVQVNGSTDKDESLQMKKSESLEMKETAAASLETTLKSSSLPVNPLAANENKSEKNENLKQKKEKDSGVTSTTAVATSVELKMANSQQIPATTTFTSQLVLPKQTQIYTPYMLSHETSVQQARHRLQTAIEQTRQLRQAFTQRLYEKYYVVLQETPSYHDMLHPIMTNPKTRFQQLKNINKSYKKEKEVEKKIAQQLNSSLGKNENLFVENAEQLSWFSAGLNLVILPEEPMSMEELQTRNITLRTPVDPVTGNKYKDMSVAATVAATTMLERVRKAKEIRLSRFQKEKGQLSSVQIASIAAASSASAATATASLKKSSSSLSKTASATPAKNVGIIESLKKTSSKSKKKGKQPLSSLLSMSPESEGFRSNGKPSAVAYALMNSSLAKMCDGKDSTAFNHCRHPFPQSKGAKRMQYNTVVGDVSQSSVLLPSMHVSHERRKKILQKQNVMDITTKNVSEAKYAVKRVVGNLCLEKKNATSTSSSMKYSMKRKVSEIGLLLDDTALKKSKANNDEGKVDTLLAFSVMQALGFIQKEKSISISSDKAAVDDCITIGKILPHLNEAKKQKDESSSTMDVDESNAQHGSKSLPNFVQTTFSDQIFSKEATPVTPLHASATFPSTSGNAVPSTSTGTKGDDTPIQNPGVTTPAMVASIRGGGDESNDANGNSTSREIQEAMLAQQQQQQAYAMMANGMIVDQVPANYQNALAGQIRIGNIQNQNIQHLNAQEQFRRHSLQTAQLQNIQLQQAALQSGQFIHAGGSDLGDYFGTVRQNIPIAYAGTGTGDWVNTPQGMIQNLPQAATIDPAALGLSPQQTALFLREQNAQVLLAREQQQQRQLQAAVAQQNAAAAQMVMSQQGNFRLNQAGQFGNHQNVIDLSQTVPVAAVKRSLSLPPRAVGNSNDVNANGENNQNSMLSIKIGHELSRPSSAPPKSPIILSSCSEEEQKPRKEAQKPKKEAPKSKTSKSDKAKALNTKSTEAEKNKKPVQKNNTKPPSVASKGKTKDDIVASKDSSKVSPIPSSSNKNTENKVVVDKKQSEKIVEKKVTVPQKKIEVAAASTTNQAKVAPEKSKVSTSSIPTSQASKQPQKEITQTSTVSTVGPKKQPVTASTKSSSSEQKQKELQAKEQVKKSIVQASLTAAIPKSSNPSSSNGSNRVSTAKPTPKAIVASPSMTGMTMNTPPRPSLLTEFDGQAILNGNFHKTVRTLTRGDLKKPDADVRKKSAGLTNAALCEYLVKVGTAVPISKTLVSNEVKSRLSSPMFQSVFTKIANKTGSTTPYIDIIGAVVSIWLWNNKKEVFKAAFQKNGRIDVDPSCTWLIKAAVEKATDESLSKGLESLQNSSSLQSSSADTASEIHVKVAKLVSLAISTGVRLNSQMNAVLPNLDSLVDHLDSLRMEALRYRCQERVLVASLIAKRTRMSEAFSNAYTSSMVRAGAALGYDDLGEIVQDESTKSSSQMPFDILSDASGAWEDPCRPLGGYGTNLDSDLLLKKAHGLAMIQRSLKKMQDRNNIKGGTPTAGPYSDKYEQTLHPSAASPHKPSPKGPGKRKSFSGDTLQSMGSAAATALFNPTHYSEPFLWNANNIDNMPYGRHDIFQSSRVRADSVVGLHLTDDSTEPNAKRQKQEHQGLMRSTREIDWSEIAHQFEEVKAIEKPSNKPKDHDDHHNIAVPLGSTIYAPFCRKIQDDDLPSDHESDLDEEENMNDEHILSEHQKVLDVIKEKFDTMMRIRQDYQDRSRRSSFHK